MTWANPTATDTGPVGNQALENAILALMQLQDTLLKGKRREERTNLSLSSRVANRSDDLLQLDFKWLVDVLGSREVRNLERIESKRDRPRVAQAVSRIFDELSTTYRGSDVVREGLREMARDFRGLSEVPSDKFPARLNQLTQDIQEIVRIRERYAESAKRGGFEAEFVRFLRGDWTTDT